MSPEHLWIWMEKNQFAASQPLATRAKTIGLSTDVSYPFRCNLRRLELGKYDSEVLEAIKYGF